MRWRALYISPYRTLAAVPAAAAATAAALASAAAAANPAAAAADVQHPLVRARHTRGGGGGERGVARRLVVRVDARP